MSAISNLGLGIFGSIVAAEALMWAPAIAGCLSRKAASLAPVELRERLEEEWAAHIEQIPGGLGKLLLVGGLVVAAIRLRAAENWGPARLVDFTFSVLAIFYFLPLIILVFLGLKI